MFFQHKSSWVVKLGKMTLLASFSLVACNGSSGTASEKPAQLGNADMEVDTYRELPSCVKKRDGKSAYVVDQDQRYVCKAGEWIEDVESVKVYSSSSKRTGNISSERDGNISFNDSSSLNSAICIDSAIILSRLSLDVPENNPPTITRAVASIDGGQSSISVTMNTALDEATMNALKAQAAANAGAKIGGTVNPVSTSYSMLVKRMVNGKEVVYGVLLTGVTETKGNGEDISYKFKGVLVDENGIIVGNIREGDGLTFNYTGTEGSENMVYEYWNTHAIDIVSVSGKKVEGFPEEMAKVSLIECFSNECIPQDNSVERPDFGQQSKKLIDIAGDEGLSPTATGELKIIPITPDMVNGAEPNSINANLQKKYVDDPSLGSYATYAGKNSKDGLCTHNPGETDPCITFNFLAMQPFRVNVRVLDNKGRFISQYSQQMDAEEFKNALGQASSSQLCKIGTEIIPAYDSGAMLVAVKLYPVFQNGKKLTAGTYIYQISIVREAFTACYMSFGSMPRIFPFTSDNYYYETFTREYQVVD